MYTKTTTLSRPQGYAVISEEGKADAECDTVTCSHCNSIVFLFAGSLPSDVLRTCGMCPKPHDQICLHCAARMKVDLKCIPFERQLQHMEAGGKFMEAVRGMDQALREKDSQSWAEDRRRAAAKGG